MRSWFPTGRLSAARSIGPFALAGLLVFSSASTAGPAVSLVLSNDFCLIIPCPEHPPPPTVATSGVPFGIYVFARDSSLALDENYLGTIRFQSSDALASLPSTYTFLPQDRGSRAFTAILRSSGDQRITVSDPANGLVPDTLTMTVTGQRTSPVPAVSSGMKAVFALALALAGAWLSQARRQV